MNRPLWVDPEEAHFLPLECDLEVDLAIIGAGLTGMGAAWEARNQGASVAVLEERTVGSGASGRNGGFVLAGPAMTYCHAVDEVGRAEAEELWTFTVENNRRMADIVREHAIDCGLLRRGSISLAISGDEMEILGRCHRDLTEAGVPVCLVPREDLPAPFDRIYGGGLYYAGNGEMNSGAFCRGIAREVSPFVSIFERTAVTSISLDGRWRLDTPHGSVTAGAVVLATNAYTSRLLPAVPIEPTRGQVIATAPLPRVIVPFPMYANYGYQYWRQTDEGRLVVGGWRDLDLDVERGLQEREHERIKQALLEFACQVVGAEPEIEYRWSGIMGFTPDQRPLVGPVPVSPGLFIAAGYSGHGVSMAFSCGGLVARSALGQSVSFPRSFDPARLLS